MDPKLSKIWILKSRKQDMLRKPLNQCHIDIMFCSQHFQRDMFVDDYLETLVGNAFPTLFYKSHLKLTYKCLKCNNVFKDKARLAHHQYLVHKKLAKLFFANGSQCIYPIPDFPRWIDPPCNLGCQECGEAFRSTLSLAHHIKLAHFENTQYYWRLDSYLRRHEEQRSTLTFTCPLCSPVVQLVWDRELMEVHAMEIHRLTLREMYDKECASIQPEIKSGSCVIEAKREPTDGFHGEPTPNCSTNSNCEIDVKMEPIDLPNEDQGSTFETPFIATTEDKVDPYENHPGQSKNQPIIMDGAQRASTTAKVE